MNTNPPTRGHTVTEQPTRFRHRVEEVEAIQWTGHNADALRAFCGQDFDTIDPEGRAEDPDQDAEVFIQASYWTGISPGYWVLKCADNFDVEREGNFRAAWKLAPAVPSAAILRDHIADALAGVDGWTWASGFKTGSLAWQDYLKRAAAVLAVLPPPADRAAVLREAADRYAQLVDENEAYDREHGQLDETARVQHGAVRDVVVGLRRLAAEAQQPDTETITAQELAHALDNSTPYPIELDSTLCAFMAERLLEMLTVTKRPEHAVWQPEEPPGPSPEPLDPESLAPVEDRLRCPQCGEDVTDYAEDDHVFRAGDERPYCSGECVVAAHRAEPQPPAHSGGNADDCPACQAQGLHTIGHPYECPGPETAGGEEAPAVVEPHCDGFPETCPNLRAKLPDPGGYALAVRCGCYDGGSPQ